MTHISRRPEIIGEPVHDSLYQIQHDPRMGDLAPAHLDVIADMFPRQAEFAKALFPALTFHLHPPLPFLASLITMKEQLDEGRYGVMNPLPAVRMPLSIVAEHDGALHRYLTPVIALARQSWLTTNMAAKNQPMLEEACRAFNVKVMTTCCCSVVMTRPGHAQEVCHSPLLRLQDKVRSATDRLAVPVHMLKNLDHVPGINADLTTHERESFARLEHLLDRMAAVGTPMKPDNVLADFRHLYEMSARA